MQDIMMYYSSSMINMVETIAVSHFDLILFGLGLMGYLILVSSRKSYAAKEMPKKMDVTFEHSEVIDANPEADANSTSDADATPEQQLTRVLSCMESFGGSAQLSADMDAFLEKNPSHPFTFGEVQTVLKFCSYSLSDKTVADRLLECVQAAEEWNVLNAFVCFYMDNKMPEKACNVFELNYAIFFDMELDEDTEWRLLMSALQCGRQSLAEHLLQTLQTPVAPQVATIQQWWRRTSAKLGETRVAHMGDVLSRLSTMFNERYPFEDRSERSDDESTCFLGDDSDCAESAADSDWEEMKE